jgi:hypothetical protein
MLRAYDAEHFTERAFSRSNPQCSVLKRARTGSTDLASDLCLPRGGNSLPQEQVYHEATFDAIGSQMSQGHVKAPGTGHAWRVNPRLPAAKPASAGWKIARRVPFGRGLCHLLPRRGAPWTPPGNDFDMALQMSARISDVTRLHVPPRASSARRGALWAPAVSARRFL